MGTTYSNVHFRGVSHDAIADAIRSQLPQRECYVVFSDGHWVTVVDRDCDELGPDDPEVSLATAVCQTCRCRALAIRVFDSDVVLYWVIDENGAVVAFDEISHGSGRDAALDQASESEERYAKLAALSPRRKPDRDEIADALMPRECMNRCAEDLRDALRIQAGGMTFRDVHEEIVPAMEGLRKDGFATEEDYIHVKPQQQ